MVALKNACSRGVTRNEVVATVQSACVHSRAFLFLYCCNVLAASATGLDSSRHAMASRDQPPAERGQVNPDQR
jgi:hypothetical protein